MKNPNYEAFKNGKTGSFQQTFRLKSFFKCLTREQFTYFIMFACIYVTSRVIILHIGNLLDSISSHKDHFPQLQ